MICEIIDNVAGKALRCLIGSFMSFSWWLSGYLPWSVPVETSEQALVIGERAAHEHYPDIDYNRYVVQVIDYGRSWCVFYAPIDENGNQIWGVFGGGGPEVSIRKTDGKIVSVTIAR